MIDYDDWVSDISFNLEAIMREEGISQRELARKADVSVTAISRYISGRQVPSLDAIINIADALDCDLDDIVEVTEHIKRRRRR